MQWLLWGTILFTGSSSRLSMRPLVAVVAFYPCPWSLYLAVCCMTAVIVVAVWDSELRKEIWHTFLDNYYLVELSVCWEISVVLPLFTLLYSQHLCIMFYYCHSVFPPTHLCFAWNLEIDACVIFDKSCWLVSFSMTFAVSLLLPTCHAFYLLFLSVSQSVFLLLSFCMLTTPISK